MSVVQSKSLLAKLLAEENIEVQHRKTSTAYFDVKQRILVCPILKDMPSDLYDLLMGHEVGHALFTPPEGWHNAAKDAKPGFKSFLNIVEDARIERKIKNKFPGIRSSFFRGYKNLYERDFFGINDKNPEMLPLIDRINLFFKLGTLINVTFSEEEQEYVDMVSNTQTWEDVVRVATALYEYSKTEQPKTDPQSDQDDDLSMADDLDEFDEYEELEDSQYGDSDDYEEVEPEDNNSHSQTKSNRGFNSKDPINKENSDPESVTDKNFRKREQELVSDDCVPNVYAEVVPFNMTNRIIPYKLVHHHIETQHEYEITDLYGFYGVSMRKFLEKNERYINYMVKEFELRKNAKQFARASVNKTGELDMQKISKYKLTEDLFKRVTIIPQGKNHGLLVFLDLSGSMVNSMRGTIEQLLILTTFCRKVNIPFEVYGFSDSGYNYYPENEINVYGSLTPESSIGGLSFQNSSFVLKQYFASGMSRNEYSRAATNMMALAEAHARRNNVFKSEKLNGTPLNEAIIASIDIANQFRKKYRLEVLTNFYLTDGEGQDNWSGTIGSDGKPVHFHSQSNSWNYNLILTHKASKSVVKLTNRDKYMTKGLLQIAKRATGANMIGFFISSNSPYKAEVRSVHCDYGVNLPPNFDQEMSLARKNKFFPIQGSGYDLYFVVPPGNEMVINDQGVVVDSGASKTDLRKAFMKSVQSKAVNRVFLSRFCNTLCQAL